MWEYHKHIPIHVLKKQYPGHPDEALEIAKREFVAECGEVLAKAVKVSIKQDYKRHSYVLTAKLITEPEEGEMATMGTYGSGKRIGARKGGMVFDEYTRISSLGMPPAKPKEKPKEKPPWTFSALSTLKHEIDEWLKI